MKLIDKDALVAEIEKQIELAKFKAQQAQENNDYESYVGWSEHFATCGDILKIIDTLEVKEVDLEKEIEKELETRWRGEYLYTPKFHESAKHFLELGMNTSKGKQ